MQPLDAKFTDLIFMTVLGHRFFSFFVTATNYETVYDMKSAYIFFFYHASVLTLKQCKHPVYFQVDHKLLPYKHSTFTTALTVDVLLCQVGFHFLREFRTKHLLICHFESFWADVETETTQYSGIVNLNP